MPGAVPREGLVEVRHNTNRIIDGRGIWGSVVYNRELSEKEVKDYELRYLGVAK
jgi:hypothetical protein